jgi:ribose-phosphate pyrophosphokinase
VTLKEKIILVDDMIDRWHFGESRRFNDGKGALSVRAICTRILSGGAYEKIENSQLLELIVTDSIPLKRQSDKIRVLSCAPLFADVMHMVHHNNSISGKFIM